MKVSKKIVGALVCLLISPVGNKEADSFERRYSVSVKDDAVRWDKENVLAVRVSDHGGNGGLLVLCKFR